MVQIGFWILIPLGLVYKKGRGWVQVKIYPYRNAGEKSFSHSERGSKTVSTL